MEHKFNFSIVVPTVSIPKTLFDLLDSIQKIRSKKTIEVIVVQNPEKDSVKNLLSARFPEIEIVFASCQRGVNNARNLGQKLARGSYILFLDDDCRIDDLQILEKHEAAHKLNPDFFAVGGFYKTLSSAKIDQAYDAIQRRWLLTNCLSLPGECLTLLGGHFSIKNCTDKPLFDSTIIYGGSETEYFWRLGKSGYKFYLIDCSVIHSPGLSLQILAKKAFKQGVTHRQLSKSSNPPAPFWIDTCPHFNFYQSYYDFCFDPSEFISTKMRLCLRRLKATHQSLISLHQKLCFFLEKKELF